MRESERRARDLFESVPIGIYRTTPDGRILLANPALLRLLGFDSFAEYAARNLEREYLASYPRSLFKERLERDGVIRGLEAVWHRRDGTTVYVREHARAVRDKAGRVLYYEGTVEDITERKQAEEALRESEERFRRYFELGLVGMALTSPAKGFIEVNEKICEILGYERSELLQLTWAELTYPDDLAADVAQFNRVLSGEIDGYSMDKRFIRKDGRIIYTIISVTCLRRADGSVDYFVVLLQDITARKRAELERAELLRQLVTAQEEERRRIALELHDQLGQDVTALMLGLKALEDSGAQPHDERLTQLMQLT
ncbi:MAG TPA: PAS domain S-box protein, partial [Pyrinomonadaceae bacterium]|nr:PAS domain S-box protein [Pyrinomonadaceae bacterium]